MRNRRATFANNFVKPAPVAMSTLSMLLGITTGFFGLVISIITLLRYNDPLRAKTGAWMSVVGVIFGTIGTLITLWIVGSWLLLPSCTNELIESQSACWGIAPADDWNPTIILND